MSNIQTGVVIYAKAFHKLGEFYSKITDLRIRAQDSTHQIIESESFQLVVLQTPKEIAASIVIDSPPQQRENNPVKSVFFVESVDSVRKKITTLGGDLNGIEKEWEFD